jgi:hypothetical protein
MFKKIRASLYFFYQNFVHEYIYCIFATIIDER